MAGGASDLVEHNIKPHAKRQDRPEKKPEEPEFAKFSFVGEKKNKQDASKIKSAQPFELNLQGMDFRVICQRSVSLLFVGPERTPGFFTRGSGCKC